MAEEKPQTFANHTRLDPLFHFFLVPIFGGSAFAAIFRFWQRPNATTGWQFILIAAGMVAIFKMRIYSLKVQDRVIRLEERLRLASLLPERLRPQIPEATEQQLIALRFASDGELPRLFETTVADRLTPQEIKKKIQIWRPDYWRV